MANDRRVSRVSSLIKREVSQMLLMEIKDQVLMVWITTDNGQKMLFQNQTVQRSSL